jgi:omega-amidase
MKITLIQSDIVWENIEQNLLAFSQKIASINEATDLIILPEMFTTGFSMHPKHFAGSTHTQINWLAEQSLAKNAVITGSIIREENGSFYNSLVWMDPKGDYEIYNKRHLFSFAGEHLFYTSGNKTITPMIDQFRIRPLICYDLRFPVWSRNQNDYDLLIYVANWPDIRIDAWMSLLKARAIENLCYVAAVNRIGYDGNQILHSGHSCVFDFKGNPILTFESYKEGVKTIEIDLETLKLFREKFPAEKDADQFMIMNE